MVKLSGKSGEKVTEGRSAMVDDLKEVVERARLAVLHGKEDTSKMVFRLVKGIWLGIEEEKIELKKLQVETKANLDEMVEERDRLGSNLMLKGYSEEEVDAIKADTYAVEEDEKEAEVVGIVDDLMVFLARRCLTIKGMTSSSLKVVVRREMSLKIDDLEFGLVRERETSKSLLSTQAELQGESSGRGDQSKGIVGEEERRIIERYSGKERVECSNSEARVVELNMNLAELSKYIKNLEENVIYHTKADAEMTEQENEYARIVSRLEK
ncbi:hypothetical protein GIB67_007038, partial [Kingdonia uniflora]